MSWRTAVSYTHLDVYKRQVCDILAQQLERGEASHEMTKMAAIMGEEVVETGDFVVNEKDKIVNLTEQGVKLSLIHI